MSTEIQQKFIPENVIYFRSKRSTFVLPEDPSREELAFDWTLSKEDKVQIFKRRGDNNRRRYAVQLCTLYILNYIQDEKIRRQVHKQLNRGEFRTGDINEIMNKVSCLSILSNAILVWNTVHISGIVKRLRQNGHIIKNRDLSRVSPMMHKHVFVNGTYDYSKRKPVAIQ